MRELTTRADRMVDAAAPEIWAYRLDFLHVSEYNAITEAIPGELDRIGQNFESTAALSLDGGGDHG